MVIYLIFINGSQYPTTMPRIVQDAFKGGADRVELWRNEKLIRTIASLRDFNRHINPRPSEDDEVGGNDYEW